MVHPADEIATNALGTIQASPVVSGSFDQVQREGELRGGSPVGEAEAVGFKAGIEAWHRSTRTP
jgi:hypothetical protein